MSRPLFSLLRRTQITRLGPILRQLPPTTIQPGLGGQQPVLTTMIQRRFITNLKSRYRLGKAMEGALKDIIPKQELEQMEPRKRLLALFATCPEGSYGFFAHKVLSMVEPVVGSNFAGGPPGESIDEFFARNRAELFQPVRSVNRKMAVLETEYWAGQGKWGDWLAGQLLNAGGREMIIEIAVRHHDNKQKPSPPSAGVTDDDQKKLDEIKQNVPPTVLGTLKDWLFGGKS